MHETAILLSVIIFAGVQCLAGYPSVLKVRRTSSDFRSQPQAHIHPSVKEEGIKFFLYTRKYPDGYKLIRNNLKNLRNSGFNSSHQTKVIVHGYINNYTSPAIQLPKNAYLTTGKYNVIAVDWSRYAFPYVVAVSSAKPVGRFIGLMVSFLMDGGKLRLSDLHIIGHSLGAHIAGFASEKITSKPARITGLDPAAPLFSKNPPNERLGEEDAEFVDVIHTSVSVLGITQNIGHADFYPGGGKQQPRCSSDIVEEVIGTCDHGESVVYFAKSIENNNLFPAVKCRSLSDALEKKCSNSTTAVMGEAAIYRNPRGIYYVEVQSHKNKLKFLNNLSIFNTSRRNLLDLKIF